MACTLVTMLQEFSIVRFLDIQVRFSLVAQVEKPMETKLSIIILMLIQLDLEVCQGEE